MTTPSGEFWHTFDGLAVPGRGVPLAFSHTYSSNDAGQDGPLGRGWTHAYNMSLALDDASGSVTVREENGSELVFEAVGDGYAAAPRVKATLVENADGTWTFTRRGRLLFTFDADGRLIEQRDLNGYETTLAYDTQGQLSTVTDPAGRALTFTWNAGRVASVSDPSTPARSISFTYDGDGNLSEYTDVAGGQWEFEYDGEDRLERMADPRQSASSDPRSVVNTYGAEGRVTSQSDELGRTTGFDYTSMPGAVRVIEPDGDVVVERFEAGLPVEVTEGYGIPDAATWSYLYDPQAAQPSEVTDPDGRVSTFRYDDRGNLLASTDALGRATSATWNELDQPLTLTDASGVTTTFTYDPAGNVLSQSTPVIGTSKAQVTTWAYGDQDQPGDVTEVVDPRGETWSYEYDADGNLVASSDPLGNTTTSSYDEVGWLTAQVAPAGNEPGADPAEHTTTWADHTAFGAWRTMSDPLGEQTRRSFDRNWNLATTTDPNGDVTEYDYDAADQLTGIDRPGTTADVARTYTLDGALASSFDGAGAETQHGYDALGRMTSVTDPLGRTTRLDHDAVGNVTSEEQPGGDCGAGVGCTTYTYDAADQLVGVDYSDADTADVVIGYDANGRRTSMATPHSTRTWAWDSLGRLTTSVDPTGSVSYGYDLAGNVTTVSYPGDRVLNRSFGAAGRMTSVTDWSDRMTTFAHDANANLISTELPNGVDTAYEVDPLGRIGLIEWSTPGGPSETLEYERDPEGMVLSEDGPGASPAVERMFGYDPLGQLTDVNDSAYAYDDADNLVAMLDGSRQIFDAANELCAASAAPPATCGQPGTSATTFDYDTRGNRTTTTTAGGSAASYAYDQADRLTDVIVDGGAPTGTYEYAPDGLRLAKTTSDGATEFVWDRSGAVVPMLLTKTTAGATTSYVYGPRGSVLYEVDPNGSALYHHHDQLGSTRRLTDQSATTVATFTYDPYGNVEAQTGTATSHFGFAGEYTDTETGLTYLRARYYDPSTGQFLTRDPLEAMTGQPYAYAGNNPTNYTDPLGLWPGEGLVKGALDGARDLGGRALDVGVAVINAPTTATTAAVNSWTGGDCDWASNLTVVCYGGAVSGLSDRTFVTGSTINTSLSKFSSQTQTMANC